MNISGTIVKQTSSSVLFRGGEYDEVFEGREIWWPLSQVQLFGHGGAGYANDSCRIITSRWIAERKAQEVNRGEALAAHYAHAEALDREEKEAKARRRATKAARTPQELAADMAAKQRRNDAENERRNNVLAERKAAEEKKAALRAAWDAMNEEARDDVYRRAGLKLGKKAPKWIPDSSANGPRFFKSLEVAAR